jgi:uncharacterized membrane protein
LTELWPFVGRFHPLLVHLPIGILVLAGVLQLLAWLRPRGGRPAPPGSGALTRILAVGAATAVVAALAGYLLGTSSGYAGETYARHQWLGIGVAIAACWTALAALLRDRRSGRFWQGVYAVSLVATLAALAGAGHLGATLAHGEGYLTEHAPPSLRAILARLGAAEETRPSTPPADHAFVYASLVEPVLRARCASCHGAAKSEGGLRLDSPDGLLKGGDNGPVVSAGRAANSELVRRIWLPSSHEDVMPPRGLRPLMPAEASLLRWWIDQGARFDQKVVDAEMTPDVLPAIEAVLGPVGRGGPTLPSVRVAAPEPAALAKLRQLGVSIVPVAAGTPFLHVHCTNAGRLCGDAQLAALEPMAPQVLWLDLSDTSVSDAGLAVVARFPNLTRLHLNRTPITDAGVAHLARLQRLEYLNLYGTGITDSCLAQIAGLKSLRTLYVWRTAVTPQGVDRLRSALPRLEIETGLSPAGIRQLPAVVSGE